MRANLVQGNALNIPLADGVVQTVVTSPPYYGLRDYSADGQLGLEPTLAEYIENMVAVFDEVWRVLRDDGTVWLNMGDSYAGGNYRGGGIENASSKQRSNAGTLPFMSSSPNIQEGMKPKDLMMVPHRLAIALQSMGDYEREARAIGRAMDAITKGYDEDEEELPDKVMVILEGLLNEYAELKYAAHSWYVRSDIVWHKPNPMPESVTDRPTKSHEYIFLLSKSRKYYYDADAVREVYTKPLNRWGGPQTKETDKTKGDEYSVLERPGRERRPDPAGRNRRSVWTITTKPYSGAHFATFPPEIPEVCIKAGTSEKGQCPECGAPWERVVERDRKARNELYPSDPRYRPNTYSGAYADINGKGDAGYTFRTTTGWRPTCDHDLEPVPQIVFDPFNGSGTTVEVAQRLGRIGVGLDLSWDYLQLARERTGLAALDEWQHGRKAQEANLEGLPMFKGE